MSAEYKDFFSLDVHFDINISTTTRRPPRNVESYKEGSLYIDTQNNIHIFFTDNDNDASSSKEVIIPMRQIEKIVVGYY